MNRMILHILATLGIIFLLILAADAAVIVPLLVAHLHAEKREAELDARA